MASISVRNGNRMESSNSWHRCANDTADFLYTRNRDHMRKSFNIWLRAQICENHEKTGIQISWHCPFKLQSYGREKTRWSIYFIICSSQLISNSAHLWGLPVFLWQQCAYEYTYIWRSQAGRPRCPGTWAGAAHETGPSQTDPSPTKQGQQVSIRDWPQSNWPFSYTKQRRQISRGGLDWFEQRQAPPIHETVLVQRRVK